MALMIFRADNFHGDDPHRVVCRARGTRVTTLRYPALKGGAISLRLLRRLGPSGSVRLGSIQRFSVQASYTNKDHRSRRGKGRTSGNELSFG